MNVTFTYLHVSRRDAVLRHGGHPGPVACLPVGLVAAVEPCALGGGDEGEVSISRHTHAAEQVHAEPTLCQ